MVEVYFLLLYSLSVGINKRSELDCKEVFLSFHFISFIIYIYIHFHSLFKPCKYSFDTYE